MIIRKAKGTDAEDLKILYFDYLTAYPPKEEQDIHNCYREGALSFILLNMIKWIHP